MNSILHYKNSPFYKHNLLQNILSVATLKFQIEGEDRINREAGKFQPR